MTLASNASTEQNEFPVLFSPIRIGSLALRNRVITPPHSSAIGNLWGSDRDAERAIAYLRSRADAGVSWTTIQGRLGNLLIPGFEPSGVSAEVLGHFRLPVYLERVSSYVQAMHSAGAFAAQQLTMIGGFPHGASARYSSPISNLAPHVLDADEIARFVGEYAFSAARACEAGIDVIELHANHDDLQEWFLSPLTNARTDGYGGSHDGRMRFLTETLTAIRQVVRGRVLGVRLNMLQEDPHGLDQGAALQIARTIEDSGLVDYLHLVAGSPWGNPSYIQPMWFPAGGWSTIAAEFRRELKLPVIHSGRINSPQLAEEILSAGAADVVGMARAHIADRDLLPKARAGRSREIRPCIGGNECISRRYVDGLPFGCAVNPHTSREVEGPWGERWMTDSLTVVGGGPAGMELAALCAEAGATVTLHERSDSLGGQLRLAMLAPDQEQLANYVEWQARRLGSLGVRVEMGSEIDSADLLTLPASEVIAIATGARSRKPDVTGVDLPMVGDACDVLRGTFQPGHRVLIVAEDDHLPPLLVADHLAVRGHDVTVVYSTPAAAVLLGRYISGSILGRLDAASVTFRYLEKLDSISEQGPVLRHIYSGRKRTCTDLDSVVLACGGVAESGLYEQVRPERSRVHILGDAYAPRRLVFATRQAYALADLLTSGAGLAGR